MIKRKSTNRDSIVYPSYNISIPTVQLLITVVIRLMLQLQLLYVHSAVTPYTQCPSVNCVTASDRPLNDSVGCPSTSLKLLTLLGFIIDETLSAGYSNMQDLQTFVRMNKLLSQCLYHHLPLSWNWETGSKMKVCVCVWVCAIVFSNLFSAKLTPHYSTEITMAQTLAPCSASGPLQTPQGPLEVSSLSPHTDSSSN